jgi:hypothetical protein
MVHYKKSAEYEELSSLAISRDKPYLKTLMSEKISFLEYAIAYVNLDYCTFNLTQPTSISRRAPVPRLFRARSSVN